LVGNFIHSHVAPLMLEFVLVLLLDPILYNT
jgi:hypothetical protein